MERLARQADLTRPDLGGAWTLWVGSLRFILAGLITPRLRAVEVPRRKLN